MGAQCFFAHAVSSNGIATESAEKVQYVENADDSESTTHIRVTYRCTDHGDGTDLSEPSAAGQRLDLYRRASDPRDLLRPHGSVGALDDRAALN